jgi:phosphate transport system substrate-binding protein
MESMYDSPVLLKSPATVASRTLGTLAMLALVTVPFPIAAAGSVTIGGNGVGVAVVEQLATSFGTKQSFSHHAVSGLGGAGAIKAVLAGALDIAVSARELTEAERAAGASAVQFARTPLAIVAHPDVPVAELSRAELAAIYAGKTRTWPDGSPIRLVMRHKESTDATQLIASSPEMKSALTAAYGRKGLLTAVNDQEVVDALEQTRGAVGSVSLAFVRAESRQVKVLRLDGVTPSAKTIADSSYPYAKSLYLVTGRKVSKPVLAFIAFIRSTEGAAALAQMGAGAVPTPKAD